MSAPACHAIQYRCVRFDAACHNYFLLKCILHTLPAMPSIAPTTSIKNTAQDRIRSVDLLRGAVMVLMAIDHVRVYSGLPAGGDTAGIFFTRWVTHFCAPAFVFFAGTSAFLYGRKLNGKAGLARYLITRGLLLVILELTLIRFCWSFNLNFREFVLAGVIWMLGWCMVLMAALVWLRPVVVGITGLAIIFLQQFFSKLQLPGSLGRIWEFVYPAGAEPWPAINILYVLVPWIGVMAAGYAFGAIVTMDAARRRRACLWIGLGATIVFLAGAGIAVSQNSTGEDNRPFIFQILDQRKYPASQWYLMMTLGPVIALVPFAEKVRGWLADVLIVFGKVPMFYYILHILVIHISAIAVNMMLGIEGYTALYKIAPYVWMPEEQRWSLPVLYVVFLVDVVLLYFLCRWYMKYKFAHPEKKWLKYL